jgi:hypothetical protein
MPGCTFVKGYEDEHQGFSPDARTALGSEAWIVPEQSDDDRLKQEGEL